MIADFRYSIVPRGEGVLIEMFWDDIVPCGRLHVPPHVRIWACENDLPNLDPLPLMSAITYGMTIAAMQELDLALTGDLSAWPLEWGQLILTE